VSPSELEEYLHAHIPVARAMEVSVVSVEEWSVVLSAPLPPNINHRGTVFGGSASALAILAAWSLLHTRLRSEGTENRLVIQRNTMEYEEPILGGFTARSSVEPADWQRFSRMLARKGKARVRVTALLEHEDRTVGRFSGEFVALT
jgi:thioesterase domain-containing protein